MNPKPERSFTLSPVPYVKTIHYRGGVITFRIPSHWTEEYEPRGGGTFFDPATPNSHILRLNVTTVEAPRHQTVDSQTPLALLENATTENQAQTKRLSDMVAMATYQLNVTENGEPLIILCWQLAQAVPPNHGRIALFTYTISPAAANDPRTLDDLALLDQELAAATFYPTMGETPKRPFWKFW